MDGKTPHEIELAGTDGGLHARLAQGLREAARFIETHPDLPVPSSVEVHYCIPASDDKSGEDEAYRIAGMLGAKVTGNDFSSETQRSFGPAVAYSAVYVLKDQMASYNAHMATWDRAGKQQQAGAVAA